MTSFVGIYVPFEMNYYALLILIEVYLSMCKKSLNSSKTLELFFLTGFKSKGSYSAENSKYFLKSLLLKK